MKQLDKYGRVVLHPNLGPNRAQRRAKFSKHSYVVYYTVGVNENGEPIRERSIEHCTKPAKSATRARNRRANKANKVRNS